MLELVVGASAKKAAQASFRKAMYAALPEIGKHNVGFPGGNVDLKLRGEIDGGLWYHSSKPFVEHKIARYINTIGIYRADAASQDVTVELNIPSETDTAAVAGFFARDSASGSIFLMHSGRVGGGRPGVGKSAFLQWSRLKEEAVIKPDGTERAGIVVTAVEGDVVGRVRRFAQAVRNFKIAVRQGDQTLHVVEVQTGEADRYSREFSGWKSGTRSTAVEYLSYHGDVVEALYEEAKNDRLNDVIVGSTGLIDLFVRRDGRIAEIFEVKTGVRRQALYTAIGQLVTHSAALPGDVVKWLVIPADEEMPDDLERAIHSIGISVRRFRLMGSGVNAQVQLTPLPGPRRPPSGGGQSAGRGAG